MTEDLSLRKSPVGWYYIAKQSVRCLIIFPLKCYVDTATDCNLATKGILTFFFNIYYLLEFPEGLFNLLQVKWLGVRRED